MAFIALRRKSRVILAEVRALADAAKNSAEFAVIVRSDIKGRGLGSKLMQKIIGYCRSRGTRELNG